MPQRFGHGGLPGSSVKREKHEETTSAALRMTIVGANAEPRVVGQKELAGKANYFIGRNPSEWRTNVPVYLEVRYVDLYPGIDLIYYGAQGRLEYDFVVRPGAEPTQIVLDFEGAGKLEVDPHGDLVAHTAMGQIRYRKPVMYQEVNGIRRDIAGGYLLKGPNRVAFEVGTYSRARALVIDPVVVYSTYLGGSGSETGAGGRAPSIAVDSAGNVYVAGTTDSLDFPTTAGSFQPIFSSTRDAFVTKLNPTGAALVYSTYIGGSSFDDGLGIAIDVSGNAYLTGETGSTDFPTTVGAFQPAFAGIADAFITKLDPTGSALVYSTYLGGGGNDVGLSIAVDATGNAYVAGQTQSCNFPTTIGAFQPNGIGVNCSDFGSSDVFVTKLNSAGTGVIYSTYLGDRASGTGIAIDATGNAYIAGITQSTAFPTTAGAFQTSFGGGGFDAFVTKLNLTGTALVYSTFLGGSGFDGVVGHGIAIDAAGHAFVTGSTTSPNFPTTAGAFQTSFGGGSDAFVTRLNPTGTGVVYSTYLGGSGSENGVSIAVDSAGNAYVTGDTSSTNFPTLGAFQSSLAGSADAFVTKLNPTGTGLAYSSYLGGTGDEAGSSIALDTSSTPNAYVTGTTGSTDFPTTPGAFQTTYGGGSSDAFVAKITEALNPPSSKVNVRFHYSANGSAGGWSATKTVDASGAIVIGPQAMEGNLLVRAGDTIRVGYDFTMPGSHPTATLQFTRTTVTFQALCASGSGGGTIVVNIANQSYTDPANSSAWYPSGDQRASSVYQGSATAPDLCGGGALSLRQGATFRASVGSM